MKVTYLDKKEDERGKTVFLSENFGRPKLVYSTSVAGVLKGFHFQTRPWCDKTVYLLSGEILDVCINLTEMSFDYGLPTLQYLSAPAKVYVPKGWAHGYFTLRDAEIIYDFDPFWDYESTQSLSYLYAEEIWRDEPGYADAIISERDKKGLIMTDLEDNGWIYNA